MTLELLNQYREIRKEIKSLEQKISSLDNEKTTMVSDTVTGSAPEYPYVSHVIQIAGYPNDAKILSKMQRLDITRRNRLAKLLAMEIEIEEYIDAISDSQLRQIITYRYLDGYAWRRVSRMIGHKNQDDQYPRRIVERHFKKCTFCTEKTC